MLILAFPDYLEQAQRLANQLNVPIAQTFLHRFPDGESLVRLPPALPRHIVIFRSLDHPNDKLIELLLCAKTARKLGVQRITLVVPYLCYMRQDIANNPGEAVSQRIIGQLLADLFDDVITVDPHLHRISRLDQAIPLQNAISLSASGIIGSYLKSQLDHAVLLGPDSESEQWVANIAAEIGFEYGIAKKIRHGDRDVKITLPNRNFSGHPVVIIDDMASTGRTLTQTIHLLRKAGATEIYAAITHPLFCDDAETAIRSAGVKDIWCTDSIRHSTSCIKLDALLATAVKSIL
ncbi:ribose-phosphate diphosphokinase [Methylicorpusculum sp.]|uniref:ribose-phosphate diphosphokinase n=1 Tax=Methylicorpusculum sp. TaxID=2713644 RepID=UPI00271F3A7C|nr:ribose-phosphate diphosphokinase [Methylicorpusculum sp.]MDO9241624.1 ribose-phosphate diphosphokinase [Methylicorpusculum sp.]MDP2177170.1 ribose-phosphate diphosphokinase [Methylicorpusculum sp.]MDP3531313.1 ribose-phosphate diphosphokinase [Methylicorpusculum sp.]MDZ4152587.1 ribose-phosphate diphosphokinase [Methylicorpusculum sp.]